MNHLLIPLLALLSVSVFAESIYKEFKNGVVGVNSTLYPHSSGFLDFIPKAFSRDHVYGTVTVKGRLIPFVLLLVNTKSTWVNGTYKAKAICFSMHWDSKNVKGLDGAITVTGNSTEVLNFTGYCNCETQGLRISVQFVTSGEKCDHYPPEQGGRRAQDLVGYKGLKSDDVLTYSLFANTEKLFGCSHFRYLYKNVTTSKPGFIIMGLDMKHCAVVDSEGDKFVQVHTTTGEVVLTPMTKIGQFFPKGYFFKDYSCTAKIAMA